MSGPDRARRKVVERGKEVERNERESGRNCRLKCYCKTRGTKGVATRLYIPV